MLTRLEKGNNRSHGHARTWRNPYLKGGLATTSISNDVMFEMNSGIACCARHFRALETNSKRLLAFSSSSARVFPKRRHIRARCERANVS